MIFTSVGHFISEEMLKEGHSEMEGDKAVGSDGITKEEYKRNYMLEKRKTNYVLLWWPYEKVQPTLKCCSEIVVYAEGKLHMVTVLQGVGCGKIARPVLSRGVPRKGHIYSPGA